MCSCRQQLFTSNETESPQLRSLAIVAGLRWLQENTSGPFQFQTGGPMRVFLLVFLLIPAFGFTQKGSREAQAATPPTCKAVTYFGVAGCEPLPTGSCPAGYHKVAVGPSNPMMKAPDRLLCTKDDGSAGSDSNRRHRRSSQGHSVASPKPCLRRVLMAATSSF